MLVLLPETEMQALPQEIEKPIPADAKHQPQRALQNRKDRTLPIQILVSRSRKDRVHLIQIPDLKRLRRPRLIIVIIMTTDFVRIIQEVRQPIRHRHRLQTTTPEAVILRRATIAAAEAVTLRQAVLHQAEAAVALQVAHQAAAQAVQEAEAVQAETDVNFLILL